MVILKGQNKITDFFMSLAWACPFNIFDCPKIRSRQMTFGHISDLPMGFNTILYVDDSTLITTPDISDTSIRNFNVNINFELSKINNWLKLNRLSINVSK